MSVKSGEIKVCSSEEGEPEKERCIRDTKRQREGRNETSARESHMHNTPWVGRGFGIFKINVKIDDYRYSLLLSLTGIKSH